MPAVPKPFPKYNKAEDQKNARLVVELDVRRCQWHLFIHQKNRSGSTPHHLYGRRKRWDIDAQVTLCMECHSAVHTAKQRSGKTIITKKKLEKLMIEKVIPARQGRAKYYDIDLPDLTNLKK